MKNRFGPRYNEDDLKAIAGGIIILFVLGCCFAIAMVVG
jgi:hypothetical protein